MIPSADLRVQHRAVLSRSVLLPALATWPVTLPGQSDPAPPAPGKLVDLGGYKLHLNCTGNGSPTVVLSAGAGKLVRMRLRARSGTAASRHQ